MVGVSLPSGSFRIFRIPEKAGTTGRVYEVLQEASLSSGIDFILEGIVVATLPSPDRVPA
jgi:hypothetical protein